MASGLSLKISGVKGQKKPKTNLSQDQIVIGRINKMIAEGAISPDIGIEIKEAIANQISEEILSENYPTIV